MSIFNRSIISTIFVSLLLSACGGSGGGRDDDSSADGFVPTDPSTVFNLFSADFFTPGNSAALTCSGRDDSGDRYTSTISSETLPETTFLGVPAIPILVQVQIKNTSSGGEINNAGTGYYSTDASDRRYLGFAGDTATVPPVINFTIPSTAKIGEDGDIGEYTDNAGFVETISWRLEDGGNGRAKKVEVKIEVDQLDSLVSSITETTLIDPDGTGVATTLEIFDAVLGETTTFDCS